MEKFNIPVVRHLDDIDDLMKFGRDGDLIPGQESEARNIAEMVYEETKKEGKDAVMLVCSDRKRSIQTADIVVDEIRKIDSGIKVRVVGEGRLASIYEGEFILPTDYKASDPFAGLPLANKAFNKETFDSDPPNDLYRFGDPVLQQDGSYKYPELAAYFKSYGESNKDVMVRTYELIIETFEKIDKLNSRTKIVVITHAQQYQIFRNLLTIVGMIKNEGLVFETGDVPRLCWKLYSERFKQDKPTYDVNFIPIEDLCDPEILGLLKKELQYLKSLE